VIRGRTHARSRLPMALTACLSAALLGFAVAAAPSPSRDWQLVGVSLFVGSVPFIISIVTGRFDIFEPSHLFAIGYLVLFALRPAYDVAAGLPWFNDYPIAPGFRIANTWVLPGLPREMEAMFDRYADELRGARPIASWRRRYRTRESIIASALVEATSRWPEVTVGSYPFFQESGPEVEVVLKSADSEVLAAAGAWLEAELDRLT